MSQGKSKTMLMYYGIVQVENSTENSENSGMEVKWTEISRKKFGYTSRGCPLFRNLCKFPMFYSALASSFGRDHSELDISCKDDAHSIKGTL